MVKKLLESNNMHVLTHFKKLYFIFYFVEKLNFYIFFRLKKIKKK